MTLTILIMSLGLVAGLAVRKVFPHLCAICFSVSSTWLILLALLFGGKPIDPVLIAMLMGGSVVGAMYYLGGKVKGAYQVFKFPFLVTAFVFTYAVVAEKFELKAVLLTGFLWAAFDTVFALRKKGFKKIALKLIECCKNW